MALKSADATISFLLTAIDCVEGGKVDWENVARRTGWYKSAKFSKQAFNTIRKKYVDNAIGNTGGANNAKRAATDDKDNNMGQDQKKIELKEYARPRASKLRQSRLGLSETGGIKSEDVKAESV
ncbi:hypothetical protein DV736_g2325, partial [Chaetothyriales sp. CBS 134916]